MEGASAVPAPALPLPAAVPHSPTPTPTPALPPAPNAPAPAPVSPPAGAPAPSAATNPAREAPGPAPVPAPQQSGPGLPANTTTAEVPQTPGISLGLLALLQGKSTNDNPSATRPNASSTTPHHPQPPAAPVANGLGLDYERHHAAIPPRPEPLPPLVRQPAPAAPRAMAQPPLDPQPEPEPAMITSDIVEATTPTPSGAPHGSWPAAATAGAGDPNRAPTATTDTPDQKRRDALRMALKRRWASGDMDHVHKKRVETIKRKKAEEEQRQQATSKDRATSYNGPEQGSRPFSNDKNSGLAINNLRRVVSGVTPATSTSSELTGVARHTADTPMVDWADDPEDEDWQGSNSDRPSSPLSSLGDNPDPSDTADMYLGKGTPASLEMANADRSYKMFTDDTGTPGRTHGALIPDGYQLSDAFPGLPFICPIRSCRKVLRDMKRLGCHFVNLHRAALLHDNEDGTLSFRGLYHPRIKGVKLPALVVSKGPPDPSEPGPVPPSMVANEALSRIIPQTGMPVAMNSPVANPTKTSEGPLRGDWKTLWNYIRPFMVDHTGEIPPQDGWVSHLITLPRVRDIEWNTPWIFTHPFRDSKPRDISAVIIQVTGELAPVPCAKCARGKGPFKGCIMISSKAQYPPLQRVLACANCFYHYGQTFCSHKAWGLKRAKKILRERKAWGTLHTVGYPSPEDGHDDTIGDDTVNLDPSTWEGPDDEASVQDDDAVGDGQDGKEADQSQGGSGTPPPDFPIIQDAEPGRPYNMWPDSTTGELRSTSGALLPAGYKFDTTTAKRPWICPVRTCRQLFIKMADLGYHFQRAHFASLLTDNGDGTLSIKGVYSSRNITSNGKLLSKSYPYVVSKVSDLQTSTSAGFVQPSLPPSCRPENDVDMSLLATPVREGDGPEDLWGYLQPFLTETTTPPEKGFVRELLTLPRVRRVELLPPKLPDGTFGTQVRKFHEKAARDVASIIIQATGDVPPEPCQRCRAGKGLMKGCVVISTQSYAEARKRYYSCANCLYHGNQTYCSLKPWIVDRPQPDYARPNTSEIARVYEVRNGAQRATPSERSSVSTELYTRESVSEMAQPVATHNPLGPGAFSHDAASDAKEVRNAARPQRAVAPVPTPRQWTGSTNLAQPQAPAPSSSSLISAGVIQPSDILEMETWEVAPGRIRESAGQDAENIAFSKAYLSTNSVVPVCEDVEFRVDTIHSGGTLTLQPDANKSRLCSIATGKVKVKTGDEPEFTIGPHGMFRIKPGTSCVVQNWMYVDAILHVTVLAGFM